MDESGQEESKGASLISKSLEAEFLRKQTEKPTDFLKKVFVDKKVVLLGDRHNSPAMEAFLRSALSPLRESGVTYLVLEEYRDFQPEVENYLSGGEKMSEKLTDYLKNGFYRRDVVSHDHRLLLLQEAKRVGLKVRFIEPGSVENRDEVWEQEMNDILEEPDAKVLLVCGQNHAVKTWPGRIANRLSARLPGQVYSLFEVTDNEPTKIRETCYVGEEIVNTMTASNQEVKPVAFDLSLSPFSKMKRYSERPTLGEEYDGLVFLTGETKLEKRPRPSSAPPPQNISP